MILQRFHLLTLFPWVLLHQSGWLKDNFPNRIFNVDKKISFSKLNPSAPRLYPGSLIMEMTKKHELLFLYTLYDILKKGVI
jgi:hypothetical protein